MDFAGRGLGVWLEFAAGSGKQAVTRSVTELRLCTDQTILPQREMDQQAAFSLSGKMYKMYQGHTVLVHLRGNTSGNYKTTQEATTRQHKRQLQEAPTRQHKRQLQAIVATKLVSHPHGPFCPMPWHFMIITWNKMEIFCEWTSFWMRLVTAVCELWRTTSPAKENACTSAHRCKCQELLVSTDLASLHFGVLHCIWYFSAQTSANSNSEGVLKSWLWGAVGCGNADTASIHPK